MNIEPTIASLREVAARVVYLENALNHVPWPKAPEDPAGRENWDRLGQLLGRLQTAVNDALGLTTACVDRVARAGRIADGCLWMEEPGP
jgi:hypothetical protein